MSVGKLGEGLALTSLSHAFVNIVLDRKKALLTLYASNAAKASITTTASPPIIPTMATSIFWLPVVSATTKDTVTLCYSMAQGHLPAPMMVVLSEGEDILLGLLVYPGVTVGSVPVVGIRRGQ
jgi:hypothetical protein